MKKIIKTSLITLLTFVMLVNPFCVHADMGMSIPEYGEVMIINENGAEGTYWDINSHSELSINIPYGTIVEIYYDEAYSFTVNYNNYQVTISAYDVKPIIDSFEPTDSTDKIPLSKMIILSGDHYLYKGPSFSFDKVLDEKIQLNTIVEYEYYYPIMLNNWIYCNYKGFDGWLYVDNDEYQNEDILDYVGTTATLKKFSKIYKSYDSVLDENKSSEDDCYTLDFDCKVDVLYEIELFRTGSARYIEISNKDIKGWVGLESLEYENADNVSLFLYSNNQINVYGDYNLSEIIDSVSFNGEYTPISISQITLPVNNEDYYVGINYLTIIKVKYDGDKEGYISMDDLYVGMDIESIQELKLNNYKNKPILIYSDPLENSELIDETTKLDGVIKYYGYDSNYNSWIYFESDTSSGWINEWYIDVLDRNDSAKLLNIYRNLTKTLTSPKSDFENDNLLTSIFSNINNNSSEKTEQFENDEPLDTTNSKSSIIVVGCVAIAFVGIIVLILNNRKKQ